MSHIVIIDKHPTRPADINHSPATRLAAAGKSDTAHAVHFDTLGQWCAAKGKSIGHLLITASPALLYPLTEPTPDGQDHQLCIAVYCGQCEQVANVNADNIDHQSRAS